MARDLRGAPFNYDSQTAFIVGNKLFYQGSGNIGAWHSCTCGGTSDGCGATNGYMQWLAADDDNGNLNDGTPHMTAIYDAFNRHGIACATPAPAERRLQRRTDRGDDAYRHRRQFPDITVVDCGRRGDPLLGVPHRGPCRLRLRQGDDRRNDRPSYTDTQVANGRLYSYNVVAAGTSSACYGVVSNCATVGCQVANLELANQSISSEQTFVACDAIFAGPDLTIEPSGNVTLHAGQKVVLRSGFRIKPGAVFKAIVP